MRIPVLAVLALLAVSVTADAHAAHVVHRTAGGHSAWWVERLSVPGDTIGVDLESLGTGEVLAHTILLLDAAKHPIGGLSVVYSAGNRADLSLGTSVARASTDEGGVALPVVFNGGARDVVTFTCKASAGCNPSRAFTLVVASAGDNMSANGFAVTAAGATSGPNTTGSDSFVRTARMFDGTTAHASAETPGGGRLAGASLAQDARVEAHVDDSLFASYFKVGGSAPSMSVQSPSSTRACPCGLYGEAPGDYAFRLSDTDTSGHEAALWWADVRMP
ncbi:MAG TPA: hypothetical protein VM370_07460 [Candidatus Thermoplasmatota archaeon]|nr:hypothetical protein [Candidatus Thermoplasmatota archaeon]